MCYSAFVEGAMALRGEEELLARGLSELSASDADIRAALDGKEERVLAVLRAYMQEIALFNRIYGLVSYKNAADLVIRHILDSLAPLGIMLRELRRRFPAESPPFSVADIGSGAGLPGIPLAAAAGGLARLTLFERGGRRARFLCNAKAVLALGNLSVHESGFEDAPASAFHAASFRALSALAPPFLRALDRLLFEKGFVAAYKGRREKLERELEYLNAREAALTLYEYHVPFLDEQRLLVCIEKNACP
jgi:16S rRNA (guanine527-N7)-methyltransferase